MIYQVMDTEAAMGATTASKSELIERLGDVLPQTLTDVQLADACMSYRHDFGLYDQTKKKNAMFSMQEHWIAIRKAMLTPGRGAEFL